MIDDTEDDLAAVSMCENNKGTIGSGSCNGYMACSKSPCLILVCLDFTFLTFLLLILFFNSQQYDDHKG